MRGAGLIRRGNARACGAFGVAAARGLASPGCSSPDAEGTLVPRSAGMEVCSEKTDWLRFFSRSWSRRSAGSDASLRPAKLPESADGLACCGRLPEIRAPEWPDNRESLW